MTELAQAFETVNLHRRAGAATIELNRPDAMNAWNHRLGEDLLAAIEQTAADDEVRVVCVTGAGRGFSAGADLKDMGDRKLTAEGHVDVRSVLTEAYNPIVVALRTMPKPVVAAVNGPAVGIGLSLALAADLIVAARSAYFLLSFSNIGLVPDGGASLFLPERVGFTRAAELALLGERLGAEQALAWGLINRVHDDEDFRREVDELLDRLAAGPTRAYAGTKRQLNSWLFERMGDQLALEADVQQEMAGSADFVEGVTAFVQKRPAAFRGA
ncbi:MAG: enoyl-CoA hydratase [Solirubrobacterales bacterium]|nr:enoyl-CoA hydratase [Solirubrobacterales bacterium]